MRSNAPSLSEPITHLETESSSSYSAPSLSYSMSLCMSAVCFDLPDWPSHSLLLMLLLLLQHPHCSSLSILSLLGKRKRREKMMEEEAGAPAEGK